MPDGFTLGDHTFIDPSENAPLDRVEQPKRQIKGAPPPTILDGLARESADDSSAAVALRLGKFCGHGEPTMTLFDVVIDGSDVVEFQAIADEHVEQEGYNFVALVVRAPGGTWHAIFRREWEHRQETLVGVERTPVTDEEAAALDPDVGKGRVSIGFEYPVDADDKDCVSWMTIDVLPEGEDEPICVVDTEIA